MVRGANIIHSNLRDIRLKRGLSQSKLAALMQDAGCEIFPVTIMRTEQNTRCCTDVELFYYCIVLDVDLNQLFGLEGESK